MCASPNSDKENIIVDNVVLEEEVGDPGPPPPMMKSEYPTIEAWLKAVLDGKKPEMSISTYKFGVFHLQERGYTIFLVGENQYQESPTKSVVRIEYKPDNAYYLLPADFAEGLDTQRVYDKIYEEIVSFTKTDTFKQSFFVKGDKLVFETNGKQIWHKQQ